MKKLLTLIKKNFKLIMRSKSSAVMIILGPLLLIILMGAAFNTASVYGIRVGVHSDEYSPLAEAIIYELNQDDYSTQKVDSEQACITGVKNGIFHVCAIFPKNLKVSQGGNIVFYVDNSKTNLIYLVTESISTHIGKKSQDLSLQLTKGIVDTLEYIEEEITDKETLLNQLKTQSEEGEATITLISNDLTEMNLLHEKTDIPLGTLQSQIDSSEDSTAITSYNAVEREIESMLEEISFANSKKDKITDRLATLSQNTETNNLAITQMLYSFKTIKEDISSVKETGAGKIVNPIDSEIKPITTEKTHLNFIFPTLLIMIMMFVSILLTSTLEIREKTSKVYFKNFITPTSETSFTISNYLTNLIIISLQTTILVGASAFFFYKEIFSTLHLLIPALLIIASIFLFIGIMLGSIFRTEETNTITAISLGFIMVFFSSAILPIETLSPIIKNIASFNPFYISESLLNQIILFQSQLKNVSSYFLTLSLYLAGTIIATIIVKKISKRRQ